MKTHVKKRFLLPALAASLGWLPASPTTAQTNFATLHSFTAPISPYYTNSDGVNPQGGLLLAGDILYGTAYKGGASDEGTVFAMKGDGTGFTTLHGFTNIVDAGSPIAGLVASGNTLYGAAEFGGPAYKGGVFAINTNGTGFTYLHTFTAGAFNAVPGYFTNSDGAAPWGGVILSGNTLYGTTQGGGLTGAGTVFVVNTDGTGFTNLHTFTAMATSSDATNSDGGAPAGSLILSGNTLYGTTELGGSAGFGTVFAINTDGTGFTNLYAFTNGSDGGFPYAGLVLSGNTLYGTASEGGDSSQGTVFAINTDGTGFATLHSFSATPSYPGPYTNSDGATPYAGLILSGNTLYGTAYNGGSSGNGAVFGVNTDGTGFTNLYSFTALPPYAGGSAPPSTNSDGANPYAGLILSGSTLYGTAYHGGASGYGTVFSLSLQGSVHQTVNPPQLTIVPSGGNIILTWPTNAAGFILQAAGSLANPVWTPLPVSMVINGKFQFSEPMQTNSAGRFYRLSSQ